MSPAPPAAPPPSRLLARPAWQQHAIALAVLLLALCCVFPELMLQHQVLTSPDYESPSHFAAAGRAAMHAGEYPLWNPYLFLGMPSFASLSFTPYVYPISEVLAGLGKLPGAPPMLWMLFYFLAAGYGLFLLLRSLDCEYWASLLGGVGFMLTPHIVSMGVFGHGSKLASVAYLPYLALLALRLRQPGRRPLWAGLLGIAIGLMLLRGHPQIAFYGLLMLGVIGAVEAIGAVRARSATEFVRFAAGLGGAAVIGFGIAAVLLLPVHAYAPVSIRGATDEGGVAYKYATNWSLSMSEIATFFLPSAAGFGEGTYVGDMPFTNFPNYLGQGVLLFGIAALLLLRGRVLALLVTLAGLALLVSFGNHLSLVYDLFYHYLPYFNKFRVPVMILVLLQLAAAAAAGLGLTALWGRLPRSLHWRRLPERREVLRFVVAAGAAAVLLVIAVQPWSAALARRVAASPHLPEEARSAYADVARRMLQGDGLRVAALLIASAAAMLLLWRRKLTPDVAGAALVALLVLDLGVVDRRMVQPQHTWPGTYSRVGAPHEVAARADGLVRWLQQQPKEDAAPLRVLPVGPYFMDNRWMSFGISSVGGYHPAKLARFEKLVDTTRQSLDPRLLGPFAVRYIIAPQRMSGWPEPVYAQGDTFVYENPRRLPRAWVTGQYALAQGNGGCGEQLLDGQLDVAHRVLLEKAPSAAPDSSATGTARVVQFAANRVEVEVTSSAPALLVLSEAYHPDWRATVDGHATPVMAADCVLRAVAVPRGTSRVVFQFGAPALRAGLGVTLFSALAALGLIAWGAWRRPPAMARATAPPAARDAAREVSAR